MKRFSFFILAAIAILFIVVPFVALSQEAPAEPSFLDLLQRAQKTKAATVIAALGLFIAVYALKNVPFIRDWMTTPARKRGATAFLGIAPMLIAGLTVTTGKPDWMNLGYTTILAILGATGLHHLTDAGKKGESSDTTTTETTTTTKTDTTSVVADDSPKE
jgi:hypothetical protein